VPSAPSRPVVKVVGTELTVTWTQPDCGGAEITGYLIAFKRANGSMAEYDTVEVTSTTAKLVKNFRPGWSYVVAVAAKNVFGFGDFSLQEVKIPEYTGNSLC